MKVAIYARLSTSDQNLNMQQEELRSYARRREMTVVEEYTDRLSGAKDNRPGLARLMKDAGRDGSTRYWYGSWTASGAPFVIWSIRLPTWKLSAWRSSRYWTRSTSLPRPDG